MDNLDLILGDQLPDEAGMGRLRDILMNESLLVLVGAVPTYFGEVSGYGRPLYNFFRTIHLEDLSTDEMVEMLRKRAEWDGNSDSSTTSTSIKPRIKAVHHLTAEPPTRPHALPAIHPERVAGDPNRGPDPPRRRDPRPQVAAGGDSRRNSAA